MGKMGQYCKAYPLDAMRQFAGWHENAQAFRKEKMQQQSLLTEMLRTIITLSICKRTTL